MLNLMDLKLCLIPQELVKRKLSVVGMEIVIMNNFKQIKSVNINAHASPLIWERVVDGESLKTKK